MKTAIHLVTRADDAGSCRSANEAILECVEAGVIKNVSFMAVGPEIKHAVELLGGRDDIAYGFHACLNAEWQEVKWAPLTNRPVLVDAAGHFLPFPTDTEAAIERETQAAYIPSGRYYPEPANPEMEAVYEGRAQLKRLRELGLNISYVDEHMGVGRALPYVRSEIRWICESDDLVNAHPIPHLDHVDNAKNPFVSLEERLKWVTGARYVWVTHPGKVAPDMDRFFLAGGQPGLVARERDTERRLLCDPRLPELLARHNIHPMRYDALVRD